MLNSPPFACDSQVPDTHYKRMPGGWISWHSLAGRLDQGQPRLRGREGQPDWEVAAESPRVWGTMGSSWRASAWTPSVCSCMSHTGIRRARCSHISWDMFSLSDLH
jgi:hypothetical protein